ncbi:hypothetical protein HYR54_07970 [Candidatus Acetothermia bacterium]|nr:hypothetical protein [Candidatus Acetothermia bacterium]
MWQSSRLAVSIFTLVFSVWSASSLHAATVDQTIDTLAELNDEATKVASLVTEVYESGLPRVFEKAQKALEQGSSGFVSNFMLEQLARDVLTDSSLIADLEVKQLSSLIGMMRKSQEAFVSQLKDVTVQKSIGQRKANKLSRRSMDLGFLIDRLEQQLESDSSKLEAIDTLVSNIVSTLSGQAGQNAANINDMFQVANLARLAFKDRLGLHETLRNIIKLLVQSTQDLRESQRLSHRFGRAVELSGAAKNSLPTELRVVDLQGHTFSLTQHMSDSVEEALVGAEKVLADGVYLYIFTAYDSSGRVLQKTLRAWVVQR